MYPAFPTLQIQWFRKPTLAFCLPSFSSANSKQNPKLQANSSFSWLLWPRSTNSAVSGADFALLLG